MDVQIKAVRVVQGQNELYRFILDHHGLAKEINIGNVQRV